MATKLIQEIELSPAACCAPIVSADITENQARTVASVFKAMADVHRIRIVNLLANSPEPVCVCDFVPVLGLSQGTVSFHLKKLMEAGLLEREQRGTWAYYSLDREALAGLADVFTTKGGQS